MHFRAIGGGALQNQLQGWSQLDNVLFRPRDIPLSGVPSQEGVQGG